MRLLKALGLLALGISAFIAGISVVLFWAEWIGRG